MIEFPKFTADLDPGQAFNTGAKGLADIFKSADERRAASDLNVKSTIENQNLPEKLKAELLKQQLENRINTPKANHAEEITMANLDESLARSAASRVSTKKSQRDLDYPGIDQTGATGDALKLWYLSKTHPELAKVLQQNYSGNNPLPQGAQAESAKSATLDQKVKQSVSPKNTQFNPLDLILQNAKADIEGKKNRGFGRGNAYVQQENLVLQHLKSANPNFNDEQMEDAYDRMGRGYDTLSTGEKIKITKQVEDAAAALSLKKTTSGLTTAMVKANQAEAEWPVFKKAVDEGIEGVGDTYFGYSPQQIADSLDTSPESQKRLANYIVADYFNNDMAALSTRMNGIESGQTIIHDIGNRSQQYVKARYPKLSAEARKLVSDKIAKVTREGLAARKSVGLSASNVRANTGNSSNSPSSKSTLKNPSEMTDAEIRAELGMGGK